MGHFGRGAQSSANTLEAERADRISRLAGLERVSTVRATGSGHVMPGGGSQFDSSVPNFRERSTVGSASATGSVGGKTTWASESVNDPDKMSEDQDDENSSVGGYDEDNASLVGFGEGANSTVSGPVSTANARMLAARSIYMAQNQNTPRVGYVPTNSGQSTPMSGIVPNGSAGSMDPKMMEGVSYEPNPFDTTMQQAPSQMRASNRLSGAGIDFAENVTKDHLGDTDQGRRPMGVSDNQGPDRFSFERE